MQVSKVKISEVKNNPKNPRLIKDDKFRKLVKSIQEFPQMLELRPIVVDENNIVLGGNMRLKACKEAGLKEVYIVKAENLTEQQKDEFIVKDNVGFGEWDWDILANEWDTEKLDEWGLDLPVDLSVQEVLEAEEDDYEVPNEINTDIVLGDLFEIGEHRLLCGDSTDSDQVAKLMNGEKADMVFTDPPYGIGLDKDKQRLGKSQEYGAVLNDHDNTTAIDAFNLVSSLNIDNLFFWGANHYSNAFPPSSCWIVWDKQGGKHVTYADVELCYSNLNSPARMFTHIWDGFRRDSEKGEKRIHPTQKPVKLICEIWEYFKIEYKIVLDLFLGSGSTMVAAHQLKRKCYGMELDPKYCQVIIDRMRKLDPSLVIKRNGEIISN
jgi:DNA modification methylase